MQGTDDRDGQRWKAKLILQSARRKGFRAQELDDACQQIHLSLIDFKYDPAKASGASERTVLTFMIEKYLTQLQRGEVRRRNHLKNIRRVCGPSQYEPFLDEQQMDHERRFDLGVDFHAALKRCTPRQREVCQALSRGESCVQVANNLGVSRYEIDLIVSEIRELFASMGMDAN